MLTLLEQYSDAFGPFRLFGDRTFRALMAAALAFFVGLLAGPWLIAKLKAFKIQEILRTSAEIGSLAELHASKKGTPTMGGLLIYVAVMASSLLWAGPNVYVWTALFVYTCCTGIGYWDDYLKVTKKSLTKKPCRGLPGRYKLILQLATTLGAFALLLHPLWTSPAGAEAHRTAARMLELWVPFLKTPLFTEVWPPLMFVFFYLIVAGFSNAINLTDGLDGLAVGCTVTVVLVMGGFAYAAGNTIISNYLLISYLPGVDELAIVCAAVIGASLAFLWYNAHPAQIFMGDTGSLALGGLIGVIAFMTHQPFTLVIVGGIFVLEALSVILQVASFKSTGKRIFRCAPIHHHFEKGGWKETQVVIRFWILSLIFAFAGLATLKLR